MRTKLKLRLDELAVDSFDTTQVGRPRGTVFGEQCTCWTYCGQNTCPGCPTCGASCNGTCVATCAYTCDDATCNGQATCYATCANTCDDYSCACESQDWCTTNYNTYCPRIQCN